MDTHWGTLSHPEQVIIANKDIINTFKVVFRFANTGE